MKHLQISHFWIVIHLLLIVIIRLQGYQKSERSNLTIKQHHTEEISVYMTQDHGYNKIY